MGADEFGLDEQPAADDFERQDEGDLAVEPAFDDLQRPAIGVHPGAAPVIAVMQRVDIGSRKPAPVGFERLHAVVNGNGKPSLKTETVRTGTCRASDRSFVVEIHVFQFHLPCMHGKMLPSPMFDPPFSSAEIAEKN